MLIEETFTVQAPPAAVADFFLDIDRVSRCVPGVGEVRSVGDDEYEAKLSVRVGPVAAAFTGSVKLDGREAPARLRATGQGRDRASGSRVEVRFAASLVELAPGTTDVRTEADVVVRGRLAQFGTGVMKATAHELVKEFSACVNAALAAAAPAGEPAAGSDPTAQDAALEAGPTSAAPLKVLPVLGRLLMTVLSGIAQRTAAWVRARRAALRDRRGT